MCYPRFVSLSIFVFAVSLALSSCGGSVTSSSSIPSSSSGSGPAPTVAAVGVQVNGVAPNRKQEVQFSEAMDPATIDAQSFQVADSSGKLAQGSVSYDPDFEIASFLPIPALQTGATYTATITTAVASAGGMHPASPYSYSFATRSYTDASPISVNSVVPAANATCVSANTPITITFDEAPDASTVNSTNIVVTGPGGAVIPVTISINVTTTQVVLTPTSPLPSGTINVTVQNVGDLADVLMTSPYTWSFSTACSGGGGGGGNTFVYVSGFPAGTSGTTSSIVGFQVAADGSTTAVPGSPYTLSGIASLAASPSGKFLFGSLSGTSPGTGLEYFTDSVAADGSLSTTSSTTQVPNSPDNGAAPLMLEWVTTDRTGATLYGSVGSGGPPSPGSQWMSEYAIGSTGSLSLLGATDASNMSPMSFTPDNRFAYYVWSVPGAPSPDRGITALVRNSDGTLSLSRSTTTGGFAVPAGLPLDSLPDDAVVAPNSNYLALTWGNGAPEGITVYSIGSDGSINNPTPFLALPAGAGRTMAWDPTGTYLFVSGQGSYFGNGDIYVVQFDSTANTVSMVSTTKSAADLFSPQMFFLNGHLFVANEGDQNLYVYNFANGDLTPAPGSPVPLGFNPSSLAALQR